MKAVVVGSGGWGTALSMVLCDMWLVDADCNYYES